MLYRCKKLIHRAGSEINPAESWKQASREALLAEIRRSPVWRGAQSQPEAKAKTFSFSVFLPNYRLIFRPIGVIAMIAVVVSSGSIATVSAARSSLPGDTFYPVKIGLERAQISLALSQEKKAELEIAFAGSRLKEAEEIMAREDFSPDRQIKDAANIGEAISHLTTGLDSVQKRLEDINKADNAQTAVGISKMVNDNALLFEENLLRLKGKIVKEQSQEKVSLAVDKSLAAIDQALVKLDETNSKSLTVMVEKSSAWPNKEAKEDAAAKLQTTIERMEKKIEVTEQKINSVSQDIERSEASKLEDSRAMLNKKESGLSGAASSVAAMLSEDSNALVTPEVVSPEILKQVVKEVKNKPEEAKKTIEDAKKILGEKDNSKLVDVLNKVRETNSIVQEAREKLKSAETLFKPAEN